MNFGFGKIAISTNIGGGGPAPPQPLTGFLAPSTISANSPNGSWSSPLITCTASGGNPPYSYNWSSSEGSLTVNGNTARLSVSGYNDFKIVQVTCTITDDDGTTKSTTMMITVRFGSGEIR